jgi:YesN/AraC family two-component response regulator
MDDYILLAKGLQKMIKSVIPGCRFKHFQDGNVAYDYVSDCIKDNKKIDMVITDIIHPGMNGYDFHVVSANWRKKQAPVPSKFMC